MSAKKQKRLWGFINGEPWLLDGDEVQIRQGEPLFFGKVFVSFGKSKKKRIVLSNPPKPFRLLDNEQYLQIDDLTRHRRCHRRTIVRHVEYGLLKVARRVGREYFFKVGEVRRWWKAAPDLRPGRRIRLRANGVSKPVSGKPERKGGDK